MPHNQRSPVGAGIPPETQENCANGPKALRGMGLELFCGGAEKILAIGQLAVYNTGNERCAWGATGMERDHTMRKQKLIALLDEAWPKDYRVQVTMGGDDMGNYNYPGMALDYVYLMVKNGAILETIGMRPILAPGARAIDPVYVEYIAQHNYLRERIIARGEIAFPAEKAEWRKALQALYTKITIASEQGQINNTQTLALYAVHAGTCNLLFSVL